MKETLIVGLDWATLTVGLLIFGGEMGIVVTLLRLINELKTHWSQQEQIANARRGVGEMP